MNWRIAVSAGALLASTGAGAALSSAAAGESTFISAPGVINIPDNGATVSSIVVSGQSTTITDVNVTLTGLTHAKPADIDAVLEGPTGTKVTLMSDVPLGFPQCDDGNNATITFDDAAAGPIPLDGTLASGTRRPTDNDSDAANCGTVGDGLVPEPTSATLGAFNGTSANGTWKLHVADDDAGDTGSITSWSLTIKTAPSGPECDGKTATIVGTSKSETIRGTEGADVIFAGKGRDLVKGRGGDDIICGAAGEDTLRGGQGDDRIFGGKRDDLILGKVGTDYCSGDTGDDAFGTCETVVE